MRRKDNANVRKARKSAGLIIAEKDIADLKDDMKWVKKVLWGVAASSVGLLITGISTLALLYFSPHLPVQP